MWVLRFWGWIKGSSSFTDWLCIALRFTAVIVAHVVIRTFTRYFAIHGDQLDAMRDQVKVQRRDQRPWIKVKYTSHPMKPDSDDVGEFQFIDIGKTPALKIDARYGVEFLDASESPVMDMKGENVSDDSAGTLFPDTDDAKAPVEYVRNGAAVKFLSGDIDAWNKRTKYRVVYLRVTYTDSTGADYWTQYCIFEANPGIPIELAPKFPARKCSDYNSTDQN